MVKLIEPSHQIIVQKFKTLDFRKTMEDAKPKGEEV